MMIQLFTNRAQLLCAFLLLCFIVSWSLPAEAWRSRVCKLEPELCQQRNQVRNTLNTLFRAARDGALSAQEFAQLQTANEQAQQIAESLRLLGFGRGFGPRFADKAQALVEQGLDETDIRLLISADSSTAARSDQQHREASALTAADAYLQSQMRWRAFRRQQQYPRDLYPRVRHYVRMRLMAETLDCDYQVGQQRTRIYSEAYDLEGFASGNVQALCRSSRLQAAKLLFRSLR